MTRDQIKNLPGNHKEWLKVFGQSRHQINEGGYCKRGKQFEERASNILTSLGIPHKLMSFRSPYDILSRNKDQSRCEELPESLFQAMLISLMYLQLMP